MSSQNINNLTVIFTQVEMDAFENDALKQLTDKEMTDRKGDHIYIANVKVNVGEGEDAPEGASSIYYADFHVYADKLNPTCVIIHDESDHERFRMRRPRNLEQLDERIEMRVDAAANEYEQARIDAGEI